jgi:hypothetical protein
MEAAERLVERIKPLAAATRLDNRRDPQILPDPARCGRFRGKCRSPLLFLQKVHRLATDGKAITLAHEMAPDGLGGVHRPDGSIEDPPGRLPQFADTHRPASRPPSSG